MGYGFTTPPSGTWFDVWVAVYWNCFFNDHTMGESRECTSENIHYPLVLDLSFSFVSDSINEYKIIQINLE